jgi:hypothetical protein
MDYHVKTVGFKSLDNGYILEYYQNLNGIELRSANIAVDMTDVQEQIVSLDMAFANKVNAAAIPPEVKQLDKE